MKPEDLSQAMNDLDDRLLEAAEAEPARPKKLREAVLRWGTVAAALAVAAGSLLWTLTRPPVTSYEVVTYRADPPAAGAKTYPAEVFTVDGYLAWRDAGEEESEAPGPDAFALSSSALLWRNAERKNLIYSPMNASVALVTLAELSGGTSRQQILAAAGETNLTDFEDRIHAMLKKNMGRSDNVAVRTAYYDFRYSLRSEEEAFGGTWLEGQDDGLTVPESRQDRALAAAAAISGNHGLLRFVLSFGGSVGKGGGVGNLTYGGLESIRLEDPPEDMLALNEFLYVRSAWEEAVDLGKLVTADFHGIGGDEETVFLTTDYVGAVNGENAKLTAVKIPLLVGGYLWLAKPMNGLTPEDILADGSFFRAIAGNEAARATPPYLMPGGGDPEEWFTGIPEAGEIRVSIPRFDISSELNLKDLFTAMGASEVFLPGEADLSPLFGVDPENFFGSSEEAEAQEQRRQAERLLEDAGTLRAQLRAYFDELGGPDAENGDRRAEILKRIEGLEADIGVLCDRADEALRRYRERAERESEAGESYGYAITAVNQPIRLTVDETGVKTGAYTVTPRYSRDEVKRGTPEGAIVFDHPFACAVTAEDGTVLLAAAVETIGD